MMVKTGVDIASSSLVTLKIEGQVEHTALQYIVQYVLLYTANNGNFSRSSEYTNANTVYCRNSVLVHDSEHILNRLLTLWDLLARSASDWLIISALCWHSLSVSLPKLCCTDVSLYQLVQSVCVPSLSSVHLEYKKL